MKKILASALLMLSVSFAFSQTYLISAGGTVTTCAGDFFDSGGAGSNYGANQNFTMTFNSNNATNTHIKMSFNSFDVDPSDTLIVYDGTNTAAPVLGKFNNNLQPPAFVRASITNTSGDLTFQFKSNGTLHNAGWFASVVCTPQCQDIIAAFDPSEMIPPPGDSNYVDICIGNPIKFAALGYGAAFPQNNIQYAQDSTTSTFIWDFGDGVTDTGRVVYHTYTQVRGYDVGLTIIDVRNCTNANYLGGRVRISQSPFAQINPLPDICSSTDSTYVTIGYNSGSVVVVEPITSHQSASQKFDSTMFIPDGPNCAVQCYNTFVTFTAFAPGTVISSAADILSICVNMEHSYAGDLGFRIICPNGSSVQLDPNTHSGGAYMGEPYGGANHGTYDNGCDPINNPPGVGWTYCWSQIYPQHGTLDALSNGGATIDSTNTVNHTNYVTPNNSLSGLIGCPLNGTWNIEICDDFGIDNGYIFWWELNLDPSLLPTGWGYSVPIDTIIWTGSFFSIVDDSTIMVVPDSGGTFQYTVTVIDEFGCSYDTTLNIQVVQTPEIDLGNDTILCGNNISYNLDAGDADYWSWSTGNHNQTQPITTTGLYYVTSENYNSNNTLTCLARDTVFIKVLNKPTNVDLGPDICATGPVVLDAGNTGFQFDWSTGATTQTITVTQTGGYAVEVAEEFGFGCGTYDSIHVTIVPQPNIYLKPDTTICSHQTIAMMVYDDAGLLDQYNYTYYWTPWGQTTRRIEIGCLTPGQNYPVGVEVTGCTTVTASRNVLAKPCNLEIPNMFTPNGDTKNDFFEIKGIEDFPGSVVKIYNRWGKKIYESDNYNNTENRWDGANDADGVYYYVLEINYGSHGDCVDARNFNGSVTIIR